MITSYEKFNKYGKVLRDEILEGNELFKSTGPVGWRIQEISVDNAEITVMSYHDNTPECFFPIKGMTILTLSLDDSFRNSETFLLDKPVVIYPCVWHSLSSLSGESRIIVVENEIVNLEKKSFINQRNEVKLC